MQPTEHELTAATEALAGQLYATATEHARSITPDYPTWDQLGPLQRHQYLEGALTYVAPILEALPDRAAALIAEQQARRPWAHEGRYPEALELRDSLLAAPADEQVETLGGLLESAHRGAVCQQADHDRYPVELEHQRTGLLAELYRVQATAIRYRLAWSSARRRARQLLEALDTYADVPIGLALDETTSTVQHRPIAPQRVELDQRHTEPVRYPTAKPIRVLGIEDL